MTVQQSYTDLGDVVSCNDCGAFAKTADEVEHFDTCKPGESDYWQAQYNDAPDDDYKGPVDVVGRPFAMGTVVVKCPFCSHDHAHNGFGRRIAHCRRGTYRVITEIDALAQLAEDSRIEILNKQQLNNEL